MTDALEFDDGSKIAFDRDLELATSELGHAEVEQTTGDFFDRPCSLGHLECTPECLGGLIEELHREVGVADHA